ncbi:MAG TPA: biotin transporter BioY [Clostridia bacterium]|nr:biotin transporter BioY [Clostridia bacterium]
MKIKSILLVALFAAMTTIGALYKIPIPGSVPVSLQFFFSALAGAALGAKLGALSQILYVVLGLIGLPIFTGGGGLSYIFMPSFGFLIGFVVFAFIVGLLLERLKEKSFLKVYLVMLAGMMSMYFIGLPYMYMILNAGEKSASLTYVITHGFLVFLPADIIKTAAAALIAIRLKPLKK